MKKIFLLLLFMYSLLEPLMGQDKLAYDLIAQESNSENYPLTQKLGQLIKADPKLNIEILLYENHVESKVFAQLVLPSILNSGASERTKIYIVEDTQKGFNLSEFNLISEFVRKTVNASTSVELIRRYFGDDKEINKFSYNISPEFNIDELSKHFSKFNETHGTFTEYTPSLYINDKQLELTWEEYLGLAPSCCKITDCYLECMELNLEDLAGYGIEVYSLSRCLYTAETPQSTMACLIALGITDKVISYVKHQRCIVECTEDPCSNYTHHEPLPPPCPENYFCFNYLLYTVDDGANVVRPQSTCRECPKIQTSNGGLDIIVDMPTIEGGSFYYPLYVPQSYSFNYTVTKNGVVVASGSSYNSVHVDLLQYNPKQGDEFCISYTGTNKLTACSNSKCLKLECPIPLITAGNGQLIGSVTQNGIAVPLDIRLIHYTPPGTNATVLESTNKALPYFQFVKSTNQLDVGEYYCIYYEFSDGPYRTIMQEAGCILTDCIQLTNCHNEIPEFEIELVSPIQHESGPGYLDGSIHVTSNQDNPSNPTNAISYVWDHLGPNQSSTPHLTNLAAGTYCVSALNESTGCTTSKQCFKVELNCTADKDREKKSEEEQCLQLEFELVIPTTPENLDGSIEVKTINPPEGLGTFYYYWSDLNGAFTDNKRGELAPGEYCVTVVATNAEGFCCEGTACITLPDFCSNVNIYLENVSVTQPKGCNVASGQIEILKSSIQGGTPNYTFKWENGSTAHYRKQLLPGIYRVTITDANGCTGVWQTELVGQNQFTATATTTSVQVGQCNGSISVNTIGAAKPIQVVVSQFGNVITSTTGNLSSYTFNNLCNGNYDIVITDANGCEVELQAEINTCLPISVGNPVVTDASGCSNDTGSIQMVNRPVGGTSPYTFQWSNGQTSYSATNLNPGLYTLTITDAFGCSSEHSWMVNQNSQSGTYFTLDVINVQNDVNNNCQGSITVHVTRNSGVDYIRLAWSGPTSGYYDIPSPGPWQNYNTFYTIPNLCAGDYTITANASAGLPPQFGCVITTEATIEACPGFQMGAAPQIEFPTNCNANDGSIAYNPILSPSGGTAPYTWLWSNGTTNQPSINNLSPGNYSLTVIDSKGCKEITTFDLILTNDLEQAQIIGTQPVTGNCNGSITVSDPVGLTFKVYKLPGTTPLITFTGNGGNHTFTNLCGGEYSIVVTDLQGCSKTLSAILTNCPTVSMPFYKMYPPTSCNTNDGSIRIISPPNSGTPPFNYTLTHPNGSVTSPPFENLPDGVYTLTVIDANGCTASESVSVVPPTMPQLHDYIIEPECQDLFNGVIDVYVTSVGGQGVNFTFTLIKLSDNSQTVKQDNVSAEFTGLETGNYKLIVSDGNSCSISVDLFVPEIIPMGVFKVDNVIAQKSCPEQNTGSIEMILSGGNKPYQVRIRNITIPGATSITKTTNSQQTQPTSVLFDNLPPGTYKVESIVDDCGRTLQYPNIVIGTYPPIGFSSSVVVDCPGKSDINLTITSGDGPFAYQWSGPGGYTNTIEDIKNLQAGMYTVTVTDSHGCYDTHSVNVTVIQPPVIDLQLDHNVACPGFPIGKVTLFSVTGGKAPYTITLSKPSTGASWNINPASLAWTKSDLDAGDYVLTVVDGCGTHTRNFTINEQTTSSQPITGSGYNIIRCGNHDVDLVHQGLESSTPFTSNCNCQGILYFENGNTITLNGDLVNCNFHGGSNNGECECFKTCDCELPATYVDEQSYVDINGVFHTESTTVITNLVGGPTTCESAEDLTWSNLGQAWPNSTCGCPTNDAHGCAEGNIIKSYKCGNVEHVCIECLPDSDGDNVIDEEDNCPLKYNPGSLQDITCNLAYYCSSSDPMNVNLSIDSDGDFLDDDCDNCVSTLTDSNGFLISRNPSQSDEDNDGTGDPCESSITDADGDGVHDSIDNCPGVANRQQFDCDGNGKGDACDPDYPCNCSPLRNCGPVPVIGEGAEQRTSLSETKQGINKFAVSPNPFVNSIRVQLVGYSKGETFELILTNVVGQAIQSLKVTTNRNQKYIDLEVNKNVPDGNYILIIQSTSGNRQVFHLHKQTAEN